MSKLQLAAARNWLLANSIKIEPVCAIILEYAKEKVRRVELKCLPSKVVALVELPNGEVASASGCEVNLWNLALGLSMHTLRNHVAAVVALGGFPDGTLISVSKDRAMNVWNTGRLVSEQVLPVPARVIATISTAKHPVFAFAHNASIWVRTLSGTPCLFLPGHKKQIRALAALPDHKLTSCADDNTVRVWDLASGCLLHTLRGHKGIVRSLAAMPNGRLASSSSKYQIKVWDTSKGKCIQSGSFATDSVWKPGIVSLSAASDGQLVFGSEANICAWDPTARTQPVVLGRQSMGVGEIVHRVIVVSDGRVVSCAANRICIWY